MTDFERLQQIQSIIADIVATRTVYVPRGGNLGQALSDAKPGDVVELEPGARYSAAALTPFDGERFATLRTRGILPERRIGQADAWQLATIDGLTVPSGCHHWRLDGLRLEPTRNTYGVIRIGSATGYASLSEIPHHIDVDRVVVDVPDAIDERRGIQVNGSDVTIRRSSVLGVKETGYSDSQAVSGWDTPGRIVIDDCDLQAAGEVVIFGGTDPSITNMVPTDILVRGCTITRPLAAKDDPRWKVKNLFELKNARRVQVLGNAFSNNWHESQTGYAFVLSPRNQNGTAPWCIVEDVLFEGNTLHNSSSAFVLLGSDDEKPSANMSGIVIRNNLLIVSEAEFGSKADPGAGGRCFLLLDGRLSSVVIDHNTCINDGSPVVIDLAGQGKMRGVVFTNNVMRHNAYGIMLSGVASGTSSINGAFEKPIVLKNVIAGIPSGSGYSYPSTNLTPSVATFNNQFLPDWRLKASSSYKNAGTDGKDLGAALEADQ